MKILDEIKRDHDQVRELFLQIENKEKEGPEIFKTLVITVLAHHEAEEKTVFGQLPADEESQDLKLELIAEHDSLRRGMQVVLDTDPEDNNWKARLSVCKEMFSHHIQEEEKQLFEKLRKELTQAKLNKLYDSFASAEEKAKEAAEEMVTQGMILRPEDYLPREKDTSGDPAHGKTGTTKKSK